MRVHLCDVCLMTLIESKNTGNWQCRYVMKTSRDATAIRYIEHSLASWSVR